MKLLGEGSFSQVCMAVDNDTQEVGARQLPFEEGR
jgi:hypothetical protein